MKRYFVTIIIVICCVLGIIGGCYWFEFNTTITNGEARFEYGEKNILETLSNDDLNTIKTIFDGKKMYRDNPSCGFSDNIL